MKGNWKWNKRLGTTFIALVIAAASSPFTPLPKAEAAGLSWPSGQILPSFSAPASTLDEMNLVTEYKYEAETMGHGTGHLDGNGWLAQTGVDAANAHMVYGPYATNIPTGANTAFFDMIVDNNTVNNDVIVTIDVRDSTSGTTLATRDVHRQEWTQAGSYQRFTLPFTNATAGHSLEFRVYWYGRAYTKVDAVGTHPDSKVDESVLFTTLKGLVNKTQPRIYTYDDAVKNEDGKDTWLNALGIGHTDVADNWSLITKYASEISGIVVYDDAVPDTINLATLIASRSNGIVAPASLVTKLTSAPYSLPILDDLRGDFSSKLAVYQYMYNNYWSLVTHKMIIGLNPTIKGFLRDYAMATGAAIIWLDPSVPAENTLLQSFLSGMPNGSGVYMGWWPDEAIGVQAASAYGVSTVASDFSSNLTVFSGTSRTVNVKPIPNKPPLQNKIYVSLILSDGDNLQYMEHRFKKLWDSSNRGTVPLGWTVSPAMLDAMPGLLNYLHTSATANDVLIAGPSGVGYTYPNNWSNQSYLDSFVALSNDYMNRAGLKISTIWNTITGGINTNVGNSFAQNAPSLLGLTSMAGGGAITVYNNTLPVQGLNATYCYSLATLISEINGAIAGWNGTSPRFVSIQANPWDVNYQNFVDAVNNFSSNSNVVFVRPDTYFQLMRENNNLPIDPSTVVKTYEAESNFSHTTGAASGSDWSANVASHNADYMLWGPYDSSIPVGMNTATFKMKIDTNTGTNDNVVTVDVRDNATGAVLSTFDVYRNQFKSNNTYQDFSVSFNNPAGSSLEYRAYYRDKATISIDKVTVTKRLGKYEAEGAYIGHGIGRVSGDGWQASSALDGQGHMVYGPYDSNVPVGSRKVTFRLKVDNNTVDNANVVKIDVYDATSGTSIVQADITRQQFTAANQYQDFSLSFNQTLNRNLEYRVWYYDNSTITADSVTIN
ncbi:GxGYxYP domain-containing protein [Paenibacillus sp. OV219]|uniref:GxGYxYP domain-containing protein n=1 Tax=Paenibacillus sp. OV219 TaxID=1884377 RepID=UPI0008D1316A|nr:GxGYxYP domain-containing protein [Paenibacillus sp. OV219]SEM51342.1 GxGYxY sequence motif-containing protein [Paenibacillus sp. OV219]